MGGEGLGGGVSGREGLGEGSGGEGSGGGVSGRGRVRGRGQEGKGQWEGSGGEGLGEGSGGEEVREYIAKEHPGLIFHVNDVRWTRGFCFHKTKNLKMDQSNSKQFTV